MNTKLFLTVALAISFIAGITVSAAAADTLGLGLCAPMSGGAASWGKKVRSRDKICHRPDQCPGRNCTERENKSKNAGAD